METLAANLRKILHLTQNEAKIYAVILENPYLNIAEISSSTKLPKSRIYEILSVLSGRGLIEKEYGSSKFLVINPKNSLETFQKQINQKHKEESLAVAELSNSLEGIWKGATLHKVALGVELIPLRQIESFLDEAISSATEEICICVADFDMGINWRRSGASLASNIKLGSKVRFLVKDAKLHKRLTFYFNQNAQNKTPIEIGINESMHTSFILVDGELFLFFFGKHGEKSESTVLKTQSKGLVKTMFWLFNSLWK